MIKKLKLKLVRWILGHNCMCYQCGYHKLVDYSKTGPIGSKLK